LIQLQRGLEIKLRALGSEHPEVTDWYNDIGDVYKEQGQYVEALIQLEESLEMCCAVKMDT